MGVKHIHEYASIKKINEVLIDRTKQPKVSYDMMAEIFNISVDDVVQRLVDRQLARWVKTTDDKTVLEATDFGRDYSINIDNEVKWEIEVLLLLK